MFDDIGGKIKKLAVVVTVVGMAVFVILGIVTMKESFFAGLLIACLGGLASWVGSFVLYGFGELIDNTARIAGNTKKSAQATSDYLSKTKMPTVKDTRKTCPYCFSTIDGNDSECSRCGQKLD